jgi:SNF2 family DNA or RNA helicase
MLMQHQEKMVEIAKSHPRYGFWLQPGLGKTVGSLAIVQDHPVKTVVVCPKSVMKAAWVSDAKKFFPNLRVVCCWDKTKAKRSKIILDEDADIYIINIDLFKSHAQDFLEAGIRRLILDESSMIKSHKAQRTKALISFADKMESVYLLSGTPAPNCTTEYFTQVRAICRDTFGPSFYGFTNRYFFTQTRPISGRDVITGYIPKKDKGDEFNQKLRDVSWSLTKEQALDLPPQTDVLRLVELGKDDRYTYEMVYAGLAAEMEGEALTPAGQAKLMKLRQLAGGFYYKQDPYGGQDTILSSDPVKIKELRAILEELGNEPVVIWANFTAEIDMILRLAREMGRRHDVIDGRTNDADVLIDRFQGGDLDCLVCHPAAAGHGITLTAASYAIYYSMDFSYERYQQSKDRIHRKGQMRPCTYYHIIADGTADESILWAVRNKAKMSDAVLRMLGDR